MKKHLFLISIATNFLLYGDFIRNDALEVVNDTNTTLMWQDNSEAKTVMKPWVTQANYDAGNYYDTSGDTAATYCSNLVMAGYSDWYLPTINELRTLLTPARQSNGYYISTDFKNYNDWYWSSSSDSYNSAYGWVVIFYNGTPTTTAIRPLQTMYVA